MSGVHVLALDQSFRMTGWAVFRVTGDSHHFVESGVIETKKAKSRKVRAADDEWRCLTSINHVLTHIVETHSVRAVFIEEPGGSQNSTSAKAIAYAYATVCAACVRHDLPCENIPALDAKEAATGSKQANKQEVVDAVVRVLGRGFEGNKAKREAQADAVAVWLAAWEADGNTVRQLRRVGARKAA